jgi:hypothetical protein
MGVELLKKKILMGISIFLGIVVVAAASLTLWQWKNIKALYIAFTTDEDELNKQLADSNDKFADDVKDYLSDSIRDFTDEELSQIESGEKTKIDILAQIISESVYDSDKNEQENTSSISDNNSTASPNTNGQSSSQNNVTDTKTETADQIVARHVANLYSYQNQFKAETNALAASAKAYVNSYKATHPDVSWHDAKVATVQNLMSSATSIESSCYSKVNSEIAQLRSELKAIGADTSIADTVEASANNQIEMQKSAFISQYKNKMS